MLPIRDTIRSKNYPIMNWILIGLNTLVFLFEVSLAPSGLNRLIQNFGIVPARFDLSNLGRVTTLILLFIFPWFVELPAVIFLGFWFVSQLFSGITSPGLPAAASTGGVAWFAHIGGFVFGMLFYKLFTTNRPLPYPPQYPDEYRSW